MSPDLAPAGLRGARFQAIFAGSSYVEIDWNLWGTFPHFLPQALTASPLAAASGRLSVARETRSASARLNRSLDAVLRLPVFSGVQSTDREPDATERHHRPSSSRARIGIRSGLPWLLCGGREGRQPQAHRPSSARRRSRCSARGSRIRGRRKSCPVGAAGTSARGRLDSRRCEQNPSPPDQWPAVDRGPRASSEVPRLALR